MKSKNKTKNKTIRIVITIAVVSALSMPLVTSVMAARDKAQDEGFLDPFSLTVSPFSSSTDSYLTTLSSDTSGTSDPTTVSTMSAPLTETSVSYSRPIRVPYRPRPRSPIFF